MIVQVRQPNHEDWRKVKVFKTSRAAARFALEMARENRLIRTFERNRGQNPDGKTRSQWSVHYAK